MRENKSYRFANLLSFIDLLFNLMLGFAAMFLLSLTMMAPIVKNKTEDVPRAAEYIVKMEWKGSSDNDIDLWVKSPTKETCGYLSKETPTMNLERDDVGRDATTRLPGHVNEEIISIREISPGWYTVNLQFYAGGTDPDQPVIKWSVVKMKPTMHTIVTGTTTLHVRGDEKTAVRFLLNEKGEILDTDTKIQTPFVLKSVTNSRRTNGGSLNEEGTH